MRLRGKPRAQKSVGNRKPTRSRANRPRVPRVMWLVYALLWLGVAAWIVHYFGEVASYDPALSINATLRGLAMASVLAALVAAFIKLFADEFIIGLIQKRSKWELAGAQVESVAMVAVGVVAEGVVSAAVAQAGGGDAKAEGSVSGGDGTFDGGGASGKF